MIRSTLNLDALAVETFATTPADAPATPLYDSVYGCDGGYRMAPITAHTDPCDVCCQQQ